MDGDDGSRFHQSAKQPAISDGQDIKVSGGSRQNQDLPDLSVDHSPSASVPATLVGNDTLFLSLAGSNRTVAWSLDYYFVSFQYFYQLHNDFLAHLCWWWRSGWTIKNTIYTEFGQRCCGYHLLNQLVRLLTLAQRLSSHTTYSNIL